MKLLRTETVPYAPHENRFPRSRAAMHDTTNIHLEQILQEKNPLVNTTARHASETSRLDSISRSVVSRRLFPKTFHLVLRQ